MHMSQRLEKFRHFYSGFDAANLDTLGEFYTPDVVFKDPVHKLVGLVSMRDYMANLCRELQHCHFRFHRCIEQGDLAFLTWTMSFAHPKVAGGQPLELDGSTEIHFQGERICYHCDYYDMGAMLYEHLPLIGPMVRWLRKRLA